MADTDRAGQRHPERDPDDVDLSWFTDRLRRWDPLGLSSERQGKQLTLFTPPRRDLLLGPFRPLSRTARPGPAVDGLPPVPRDGRARWLLVAAVVGYVWLFAYWTTRHHDGLGTQAFDFGIYDQGLWLLSQFKRPFITVMGRHLFGDHTSFILLPLVPVFWVVPSAKVLLIAQSAALGAGAIPTFLLAREKLRNELLAALLAVAFLLHPVLGWTNLEGFHPDAFQVPLALFALYFMVRHRWVSYFVCVALLLLVKEDVVLFTLPLGIYVALKHDRRVGIATCAVSLVYAAIALWWILPTLNSVGTLNTWRIPFGGPGGLVRTALAHPGRVISYVTSDGRPWYLWQLVAPLGLVALAAPGVVLIGIGALASNLLTTFPYQYDIHYHYSTLIVPVLVAATIAGIASWPSPVDRKRLVGLVLGASLVAAYLWGPTPLGRHEAAIADPGAPVVAHVKAAARALPEDAAVSVFYAWLPQVDHREEVYMFPNPWKASYWGTFTQEGQRLPIADRVEYILLPSTLDPEPKAVLDTIRSEFVAVYDQGGVQLLRRRA